MIFAELPSPHRRNARKKQSRNLIRVVLKENAEPVGSVRRRTKGKRGLGGQSFHIFLLSPLIVSLSVKDPSHCVPPPPSLRMPGTSATYTQPHHNQLQLIRCDRKGNVFVACSIMIVICKQDILSWDNQVESAIRLWKLDSGSISLL